MRGRNTVIERICRHCQAANPEQQRFCGNCGTPLEQPLQRRSSAALALRPINIPARWRQTGKVMALGVATLVAEAGVAWLRRQQAKQRYPQPVAAATRVYALRQRVLERWSKGQLQERTIEQTLWLSPDDQPRRW